jgi:hypothetical protein
VLILKIDKVLCFETLSEVFILKELVKNGKLAVLGGGRRAKSSGKKGVESSELKVGEQRESNAETLRAQRLR